VPLCGKEGVEIQRRYYKCTRCGLVYGRDWTACYNAAKLLLKACKAERQLEALNKWLSQHPKALAKRYYMPRPKAQEAQVPAPIPPAPTRGDSGGAARGAKRQRGAEAEPRRTAQASWRGGLKARSP